jgi:hypothetical protein
MNDIFMKYLDEFIVAYLNDILIYNNNAKKHREHVRKMLLKFREADIQVDINKCEFNVFETKFVDVIINVNEICMNSKKIQIIVE